MWELNHKDHQRIDALKLLCWRRFLRVPWTARRSNQSILKEINSEYSLEGLMLKLKVQYFAPWCEEPTHWKRPWCWKRLKAREEGPTEEMVGWHHQLNGHEFEQALGVGDGQGSLVCCSPWGSKESDTTEPLNWLSWSLVIIIPPEGSSPQPYSTRNWFHAEQSFHRPVVREVVSGWFKHMIFIVHFISSQTLLLVC